MNKQYVKVGPSEMGPSYWAARSFVPNELRTAIESAALLVVPQEGFRDRDIPMFPVGTEDLVGYFRDHLPPDVDLEVPISDDDYEELALHADLLVLGTFVVTAIAAPIFVNLVSEAVKHRFPQYFGGTKKAEAKLEIHVQRPDGAFAKVEYEGPVEALLPTVAPVVAQLSESDRNLIEIQDEYSSDSDTP